MQMWARLWLCPIEKIWAMGHVLVIICRLSTIFFLCMMLKSLICHLLWVKMIFCLCIIFLNFVIILPAGSSIPPIFKLLILLYQSRHVFVHTYLKKIFLFQFFSTLGLYPEDQKFQQPSFVYLASTSIDKLSALPIDLMVEKELDMWLLRCVSLHPCIFKILRPLIFYMKIGSYEKC